MKKLLAVLVLVLSGVCFSQTSDSVIVISKVRTKAPVVFPVDTSIDDTTLWPSKGLAKGDTAEIIMKINGSRQYKYTAIDTCKLPKTWRLVPVVRINWLKIPRDTVTGNLIR